MNEVVSGQTMTTIMKKQINGMKNQKLLMKWDGQLFKCENDLGAEMGGPTNAAHSHVDIGEIDRPETTQGTMQVDTNTSVENTMLLPIIIKGKVLNRHALSVA